MCRVLNRDTITVKDKCLMQIYVNYKDLSILLRLIYFQTLNVVVDNCRDIKVCRVLDCDTITQVKDKCLTQIYVNYPASNLTVKPEELELGM